MFGSGMSMAYWRITHGSLWAVGVRGRQPEIQYNSVFFLSFSFAKMLRVRPRLQWRKLNMLEITI